MDKIENNLNDIIKNDISVPKVKEFISELILKDTVLIENLTKNVNA